MLKDQDAKLAELVLYVSEKSAGDENFGATKLNKVLFYADFIHYARTGESITGQEYFKLPNGPAPRRLVPVREELREAGDLVLQERNRLGYKQIRPVPVREADLNQFTGTEISVVDEVIDAFWNATATRLSDHSHTFDGWKLASDRGEIPYESVFISDRPLTEAEAAYALELAD